MDRILEVINQELQIIADEDREERVAIEYEELLNEIELQRQYEFLTCEQESADMDAIYYGELYA